MSFTAIVDAVDTHLVWGVHVKKDTLFTELPQNLLAPNPGGRMHACRVDSREQFRVHGGLLMRDKELR